MAHTISRWVLVIAGVVLVTGILGTCSPSRGEEQPVIQETLDKKISIDLAGRPFTQAVEELAKAAGVSNTSIQLDDFALRRIDFKFDQPITLKLDNVSLRSAVRHLLRDVNLEFNIRDDVLLISSPDEINKTLITKVYNVRDLINRANKLSDEYDYDPLIDVLTSIVLPTSWDTVGGAASAKGFQDTLIVSQSYPGHEQVSNLLAALRRVRTQQVPAAHGGVLVGDRPEYDTIRAALDQPVTFDGQERSLGEWTRLISDKYGVPIVLDHHALTDIGHDETTRVTAKFNDLSLRSALRLMLRRIDLNFLVQDEAVVVTTPDEVQKRLETRVYKVPDLIATHDEHGQDRTDYGSLIDVITTTVRPTTWDRVGGAGGLKGFDMANALVCSQTAATQEEVDDLIYQMRTASSQQETESGNQHKNAPAGPPEYFIGRYELKLPPSGAGESAAVEQIMRVVKDLAEPASWKKDGGYIEAVGTTLVVRQTPQVHRQVGKLLKDLRLLGDSVPTRGSGDSGTQYRRMRRGT